VYRSKRESENKKNHARTREQKSAESSAKKKIIWKARIVQEGDIVCCSVMQCVAVCCSVLSVMQCVAVCCSVAFARESVCEPLTQTDTGWGGVETHI